MIVCHFGVLFYSIKGTISTELCQIWQKMDYLSYSDWCAISTKKVRKLCVNPCISIINPLWTYMHTYIHTYKHNLRLRPHQCLPRLHDYEPHANTFSNKVDSILKYRTFDANEDIILHILYCTMNTYIPNKE